LVTASPAPFRFSSEKDGKPKDSSRPTEWSVHVEVETADPTLIAHLKTGDARAFDAIYATWRPRIFSFLVRQLGDRAIAEDLLQETFLRLVAHRAGHRDDTDVGAWLFTVARHLTVSHMRWRRFTVVALGILRRTADRTPAHALPDDAASRESIGQLETALAALPPDYREVVLLVAVEGLEPSRAAAVIGIRPEALRKRLSRARAMLSEALTEDTVLPVLVLRSGERR
jgi:RNA polymerase sigma-70 factor (ECF subfamily)